MIIEKLKEIKNPGQNPKLTKAYSNMQSLLGALSKKEIPSEKLFFINTEVKLINSFSGTEKELTKILRKSYSKILAFVEKELKLIPKNHYRNLWMAIGISVFGISLGSIFSTSFHNSAYIGMGIPMGMVLGMIIGMEMDKKAVKNGKQLELDRKF